MIKAKAGIRANSSKTQVTNKNLLTVMITSHHILLPTVILPAKYAVADVASQLLEFMRREHQ